MRSRSSSHGWLLRSLQLGCFVAPLVAGCALTSKGEALTPRYFTPVVEPAAPAQPPAAATNAELRLGMVAPAAHLEQRIAYRVSDTELAYYDDRRWSEPPEELVRRALAPEIREARIGEERRSGLARLVRPAPAQAVRADLRRDARPVL